MIVLTGAGVRASGEPVGLGRAVMAALVRLVMPRIMADAEQEVEIIRASVSRADAAAFALRQLTDGAYVHPLPILSP
ncbi:MAG: hypothetical protein FJ029_10075 [Actinobacteria bacterium]|nr:hypothetical protein [Actinomycetota bacterium]